MITRYSHLLINDYFEKCVSANRSLYKSMKDKINYIIFNHYFLTCLEGDPLCLEGDAAAVVVVAG